MSHIDQGPLASYNSLADKNLAGFFTNTRMRRHLKKAGLHVVPEYQSYLLRFCCTYINHICLLTSSMRLNLEKSKITRHGEIVSENTYRLNMSRKEHKKHVKDMLAQAIVHKTLDLERSRQSEIRKKFEEIAKIELVRRVRAERNRQLDESLLPYLSPRTPTKKLKNSASRKSASSQSPSSRGKHPKKESNGRVTAVHERASRERTQDTELLPYLTMKKGRRPESASDSSKSQSKPRRRPTSYPSRKGGRPVSALSSNYDDDEEVVIYLDDEGRPITPSHVDETELKYYSKDPIDSRHLYSLDTAALRKYAMLMAKMEQGRGVTSPYVMSQVPIPPRSPRSSRTPRSAQRYRNGTGTDSSKSRSPKRPATALHPAGTAKRFPGQQETLCEVHMVYHGSNLHLAREQFDRRQDIVVEQQHCGGNTLTVFRDKLDKDTKFVFVSYRHRGYPFSLTIYVDGKMDCRVSTCCEYRHQKGGRIGGKNGHFSISKITGAIPCYKCQVERGIRTRAQAPRPKMKRPPQHHEEVVVVETQRDEPEPQPEPVIEAPRQQRILVPVDDVEDQKTSGGKKKKDSDSDNDYDDDFESDSGKEDYAYHDLYSRERGDDEDNDEDKASSQRLSRREQEKRDKQKKSKQKKDKYAEERRGKRSGKASRSQRDSDDYSSDSSCSSNESYYGYKQRMLKKIEKEMKASKSADSGNDENTESGTYVKERATEEKAESTSKDKAAKKKSSTSSAVGRAEPMKTTDDGQATGGQSGVAGASRSGKPHSSGRPAGANDVGDTADEVSDIESEMAGTSPRKSDTVGNLTGPDYSSEDGSSRDGKSHEGGGTSRSGRTGSKSSLNGSNDSLAESLGSGVKREGKGKRSGKHVNESSQSKLKRPGSSHPRDVEQGRSVSPAWERVLDNAEGVEEGLKLDLGAGDNAQRGDGAFDPENIKPDSDSRGESGRCPKGLLGLKSDGGGMGKSFDEDEERASLRKVKPKHRRSDKKRDENDKNEDIGFSEKKSKHRVKKLKEELQMNCESKGTAEDVGDAGIESKSKHDDGGRLVQQAKPKFDGKITTIPMTKTGENEYLIKQAEEEAERREKSESLKKNLAESSKRHGKYYKDLSPREKVIRGYAGDSGSNDDDETYSKVFPLDERASLSDQEHDYGDPKNYVLAGADGANQTLNTTVHSAVEVDDYSNDGEEQPQYIVLIDTMKEQQEKARNERRRREEEDRKLREQNRENDVRGQNKGKSKSNVNSQEIGRISGRQEEDRSMASANIHPSLKHKPKETKTESDSGYKLNHPRFDSEGELEAKLMATKSSDDLLLYRQPCLEEPVPRLFRPGINDNAPIETKLKSQEDLLVETEDKIQKEESAASPEEPLMAKQPLFGEKIWVGNNEEVGHNKEGDPRQEEQDAGKATEEKHQYYTNTDQNTEKFDVNAEIIGTRYVDSEGERYAKHHRAFNEAPVVDNNDFFKTGTTVSVISPQDRGGLPQEEDHKILALSVNQPGEKYDAEDIKFEEQRREVRRKTRDARNTGDEDNGQTVRSQSVTVERQELKDVQNPASGDRRNMKDDLEATYEPRDSHQARRIESQRETSDKVAKDTVLHEHKRENKQDGSGMSILSTISAAQMMNYSTPETSDKEKSEGKDDDDIMGNNEEKTIQRRHKRRKRSESITAQNLRDMWLGGQAANETQDILLKVMNEQTSELDTSMEDIYTDRSRTHDQQKQLTEKEKKSVDVKPETGNKDIDPEESVKKSKERKSKGRSESVTAINLMDMWLGGQKADEARTLLDRSMNEVSEADSSYEVLPGTKDVIPSASSAVADQSTGNKEDHVNGFHDSAQPVDNRNYVDQVSAGQVIATESQQPAQSDTNVVQAEEGSNFVSVSVKREGSSDEFSNDEKNDGRRDSNYMADASSDNNTDSDSRRHEGSTEESRRKKRLKRKVKVDKGKDSDNVSGAQSSPKGNADEELEQLYAANVRKGSVPGVIVTVVDEDKNVEESPKKDGGEENIIKEPSGDDDDQSSVSDVSGIDALIECLEEQLSGAKRLRHQSESSYDLDNEPAKAEKDLVDGNIVADHSQNKSGSSQIAASEEVDLMITATSVNAEAEESPRSDRYGPMATGAFSVKPEESLISDPDFDGHGSYEPSFGKKGDDKDRSLSMSHGAQEASPRTTEVVTKDSFTIDKQDGDEGTKILQDSQNAESARRKLTRFIDNVGAETQKVSPETANLEPSIDSSADMETISGEDEEDAARRYVDDILSKIRIPTAESSSHEISSLSKTGDIDVKDSSGSVTNKAKAKRAKGSLNSQHEEAEANNNSVKQIGKSSDALEQFFRDKLASSQDEHTAKDKASPEDTSADKTDGDETDKDKPDAGKISSLVSQGSEHAERRRQRKLTVSFAVDVENNEDATRDKNKDIQWDTASEREKDEEYEKLEKQIERSLCKEY